MFSYIGGWKGGRQNGNGIIKFNSGEWISKEKLVVTALLNSDDISYKVSSGRKLRERIQKKRKSSLVFRKLFRGIPFFICKQKSCEKNCC